MEDPMILGRLTCCGFLRVATPCANVIKLFCFVTVAPAKYAGVFFRSNHFHQSVTILSKATDTAID
jgi:hypothetical protein